MGWHARSGLCFDDAWGKLVMMVLALLNTDGLVAWVVVGVLVEMALVPVETHLWLRVMMGRNRDLAVHLRHVLSVPLRV